jgi:hypothetical protein
MSQSRVRNALLLIVSLVFVFLSLPELAYADPSQSLNIQLSPLPIELSASPGSSTSADLRVRNSGTQPETIKITTQSVSQVGENGQIELHPFSSTDPLPSWVHFDRPVFTAPAGQWQTIKMTVNLPKSAAYGYYYAVQFQLANPAKPQADQTAVNGAADIFVLLNAQAPGEAAKADIASFTVEHKSYEFLPASFAIRVHNSGNIHIAPHGNIFITRGASKVDSIDVNSTLGDILPGSNRLFTASWDDGFPVYKDVLDVNGQTESDGKGGVKQRLSWNFTQVPKLRFGKYTAELYLVYNDGQRDVPMTATVSFWVIPWRVLAVILFIAIFVGIGLWSTFKKFGKAIKKNKQAEVKR